MKFSKKKVLGGTAIVSVAGLGVATAAILLTTSVSGDLTVNAAPTVSASDDVTDVRVGQCTDMSANGSVAGNGESFTINATVGEDGKVVKGEEGATERIGGSDDVAGSCAIEVDLTNTGDVPLSVVGQDIILPTGWSFTVTGFTDSEGSGNGQTNATFVPGETLTIHATLSANNNAVDGQIKGSVDTAPTDGAKSQP